MIVSFLILRIWSPFIFEATIFPLENLLIAGWATANTFPLWSITSLIIWSSTFVSIRIKYWRLSGDWCFARRDKGLRILLKKLLSRWERIALVMITLIMLSILLVFRIACGLVISPHIMTSCAPTLLVICCWRVIFLLFRSLILIYARRSISCIGVSQPTILLLRPCWVCSLIIVIWRAESIMLLLILKVLLLPACTLVIIIVTIRIEWGAASRRH